MHKIYSSLKNISADVFDSFGYGDKEHYLVSERGDGTLFGYDYEHEYSNYFRVYSSNENAFYPCEKGKIDLIFEDK